MNSARGVLCDTCFWIAAFHRKDGHHSQALEMLENLRGHDILMPWPIMYEVLRTRTVKHSQMIKNFERVLGPKLSKIDDSGYRERCLEEVLEEAKNGHRPLSLVDRVVRAVLADTKYRITILMTFNGTDFYDICRKRKIEVWPQSGRTRN